MPQTATAEERNALLARASIIHYGLIRLHDDLSDCSDQPAVSPGGMLKVIALAHEMETEIWALQFLLHELFQTVDSIPHPTPKPTALVQA